MSEGAVKEFEKASAAAQAKTGQIELYSGKYYAACTLGGIFACVRRALSNIKVRGLAAFRARPIQPSLPWIS